MVKGCILPWIHLYSTVDGQFNLCCHLSSKGIDLLGTYKDDISTIFNNEKYKKVRRDFLNGKYSSSCKDVCYDVEKLGAESNRQQVNKRFAQFSKLQDHTDKDGSISNDPIYLDIRFGIKCNFKCRICGPWSSSAWLKDSKYIPKFKNSPMIPDYFSDNDEFWDYLYKIKSSLKYFYFAGGEPLIMDGHYKLLQWLIDNNKTDVELTYNTNLSTLTYKNFDVFDMWSQFENISLWPSVDGYKEHCEYSRTNFDWYNFEKNLKKIRKYVRTVSCTVSVYSILTTVELIAYLKSIGISTYLSVLDNPVYFDCRLLPPNIKDIVIKKFSLLKKKFSFNESEIINMDKTISFFKNDIENKDHLLLEFKKYNQQVDKLNNTSFIKIYPELKQWYEAI